MRSTQAALSAGRNREVTCCGKIALYCAIVLAGTVVGNFTGRAFVAKCQKQSDSRIAGIEQVCGDHDKLICHMMTQFFAKYEIVPETVKTLDGEMCKPCRYGWAPVECDCKCKFKTIETGRYFLKLKNDKGGAK